MNKQILDPARVSLQHHELLEKAVSAGLSYCVALDVDRLSTIPILSVALSPDMLLTAYSSLIYKYNQTSKDWEKEY